MISNNGSGGTSYFSHRAGGAERKEGVPQQERSKPNRPLFSSTTNKVGNKKLHISRLLEIIDRKDINNAIFQHTNGILDNNGNFISLAEIREQNQKKRYAQYLNLIDQFNMLAKERLLEMAFVTVTLKKNRFNPEDVSCVKTQSNTLRDFHKKARQERIFKEPNEKRRKKLGLTKAWYYVPPERFQYIYCLEFQKDLTLHSHCAYYIPNEEEAFIKFYEVIKRKHQADSDIGRTEYVIPKKYKEAFLEAFKMKKINSIAGECYAENSIDLRRGDFLYVKFINDEDEYKDDYFKQVMLYVSKYVLKGAGFTGDGEGSSRAREEDALIRFNKLKMISYSRTLAPFLVFNRFYNELKDRGIDLLTLTKMIETGEAEYQIETKDRVYTVEELKEFATLMEFDRFIDDLELNDGFAEREHMMSFNNYWVDCYEQGITSPIVPIQNIHKIPDVTFITLKLKDETHTWHNKEYQLCRVGDFTSDICNTKEFQVIKSKNIYSLNTNKQEI